MTAVATEKKKLPAKFRVLADIELYEGKVSVSFPFEIRPIITTVIPLLTRAEQSILNLMQQGYSHKEIGARVHSATRTVKFHACSIFKKFSVTDRSELLQVVGYKTKEK